MVETGSDRKTEMISKAVSWTGAGKKYVDIICKKGKLTVKNPKTTAINCKIEHALTVSLQLLCFWSKSVFLNLQH